MKERKVMKLASRGKRLGAYCIDAVVPFVSVMILLITFGVMAIMKPGSINNGFGSDPYSEFGFGNGYGYGYGYGYNGQHLGGIIASIVIAVLLLIAYTIAQLIMYSKSKTIGKAILDLQVVSSSDGNPIGFWKMLFREWFVKKASASVFFLGYIWVLVDDKNRSWHDKVLDTYVVDLKESEKLNYKPKKKTKPAASVRHETQKTDMQAKKLDVVKDQTSYEVTGKLIEGAESTVETADKIAADAVAETLVAEQIQETPAVTETVQMEKPVQIADEAVETADISAETVTVVEMTETETAEEVAAEVTAEEVIPEEIVEEVTPEEIEEEVTEEETAEKVEE